VKDLSPIGWALRPLKQYANFTGRASRAEFWWFFLFVIVAWTVVYFVLIGTVMSAGRAQTQPSAGLTGTIGVLGIVLMLAWLALLIPSIAVQTRRLHDTNRSGWWLGAFYLIYAVYLVLLLGTVGSVMGAAMTGAQPDPSQAIGPMFIVTMIVGLAMFVYAIVLLVFYCQEGTRGDNLYGPDPYATGDLEQVFG
jgi:uncharacterized membrane protein YhaH (DUF805 family)